MRCRQMGRPVIVASHLLQSMIEYPTPTRAEVGSSVEVSGAGCSARTLGRRVRVRSCSSQLFRCIAPMAFRSPLSWSRMLAVYLDSALRHAYRWQTLQMWCGSGQTR